MVRWRDGAMEKGGNDGRRKGVRVLCMLSRFFAHLLQRNVSTPPPFTCSLKIHQFAFAAAVT